MRAVLVREFGGPEQLRLERVARAGAAAIGGKIGVNRGSGVTFVHYGAHK